MRKLTALFTACLMAAAMMVPAFAADVEEVPNEELVPDVVIVIDLDEEEVEPHNAELCDCGAPLYLYDGPKSNVMPGTTKYPYRMCRHNNPNHMVVDRTLITTTWYKCSNTRHGEIVKVETRQKLEPDCTFN